MRLHTFIELRQEEILSEWDAFATSLHRATSRMTREAIRDHAREILHAVALDLSQSQSAEQQFQKSIGRAPIVAGASHTAAQTHAVLRAKSGFDINELVAEYRALRASVLRLWAAEIAPVVVDVEDMVRFNEAIDQAITESVTLFTLEMERSRNLLLGMLGHDMRNPLGVIVMTAGHLHQLNAGDAVSHAATRLINSGARLQALLNDLVDFNRSNLGVGIRVSCRSCDIGKVCEEQVDLLEAAHPGQQVMLDRAGDLLGFWDAERLHQLVGNLVKNALKYGDKQRPVRVHVEGDMESVTLEVANEGEPIAEELLADIFKPLRRGREEAEGGESLGLGLYIVAEIAKAHQGEVSVESTASGTVFKVKMPKTAG